MELFSSIEDLARVLGGAVKWRRTEEALRKAPSLPRGTASSLGDSLTFWVHEALPEEVFTAHRRYLSVLQPLDGPQEVEVAAVFELEPVDAYSDLSDRQHLRGSGQVHVLQPGSVAVVDVSEACRLGSTGRVAVVRVTVEGASFHNK